MLSKKLNLYTYKIKNHESQDSGFFVYFIAKKKIFKRAVDRNRAKRRIRAALLSFKQKDNQKFITKIESFYKNKEMIFFLENGIMNAKFDDIVLSFDELLYK